MTTRIISRLRPERDETLLSYLRRTQEESGYSEAGFNAILSGGEIVDSRSAERRTFDWWTLERFFNADAFELYRMSERSLFYAFAEEGYRGHFRLRAPWTRRLGYGAHSPLALREDAFWRRTWLSPVAWVCPEENIVLLRHCHGCGGELESMTWRRPSPICPTCYAHLSLGPVVRANSRLSSIAAQSMSRYGELMKCRTWSRHDYELAYFAVLYRATDLLLKKIRFAAFASNMAEREGLGGMPLPFDVSVENLAIRHAQCGALASLILKDDPTIVEHYWLAAGRASELRRAEHIVLFKLTEYMERKLAVSNHGLRTSGQRMISFASWEGLKANPKAA